MKKRFIILLGAPGSGKKARKSSLLSSKYQIPNLSTGDLIRNEIQEGSSIGNKDGAYD